MMLYFFLGKFIFILIISGSWCEHTERISVSQGQSFSFDCQQDESVYFSRRLGDWSEIQENSENYLKLNLKFNYLNKEKILRVTSDSAQSEHNGYYGCRKAIWTSTSMTRTYHLVLADVQSFYWTYVCHAPPGSCARSDDLTDETISTLEVSDQTNIDLFCCASVTGYKDININMNQIGEKRGNVDVKRKQELDGSWVVCATQQTLLKRTSSRKQETLTCELITDNLSYSSFSSVIVMKDPMDPDPDIDPPFGYTPPSRGSSNGDEYFNRQKPSAAGRRGKLTRKRIIIIICSIIGGLLLLGLLFLLIFILYRKKKTLTSSKPNKSHEYSTINAYEKSNETVEKKPIEEESIYIEPTPLYENAPVFIRL